MGVKTDLMWTGCCKILVSMPVTVGSCTRGERAGLNRSCLRGEKQSWKMSSSKRLNRIVTSIQCGCSFSQCFNLMNSRFTEQFLNSFARKIARILLIGLGSDTSISRLNLNTFVNSWLSIAVDLAQFDVVATRHLTSLQQSHREPSTIYLDQLAEISVVDVFLLQQQGVISFKTTLAQNWIHIN